MVCPMRFVLVGISLMLAGLAWWRCGSLEPGLGDEGQAGAAEQQRARRRASSNSSGQPPGGTTWKQAQAAGRTLLDMFTGRYLYSAAVRAGASKQL